VLGENSPLVLALPKALGRAIVSESETRSDCIKSSLVVIISVTCSLVVIISVTCNIKRQIGEETPSDALRCKLSPSEALRLDQEHRACLAPAAVSHLGDGME
jgi:hypothetical protein